MSDLARGGPLQPQRDREGTLTHVIETLLDRGLVINADITVAVGGGGPRGERAGCRLVGDRCWRGWRQRRPGCKQVGRLE